MASTLMILQTRAMALRVASSMNCKPVNTVLRKYRETHVIPIRIHSFCVETFFTFNANIPSMLAHPDEAIETENDIYSTW